MAWDDTQETANERPELPENQKSTAEKWNNMVADQKSRVLYGTLADRASAGSVDNGTVYLVTDLANDGGVITKVVDGSWEIQQIGDDTNRPDVVGGDGDFNSLGTEEAQIGDADAVTGGPVGTKGELFELVTISLGPIDTTFTNTSPATISDPQSLQQLDLNRFELTNISDIYIYWNVRQLTMDTEGETAYARIESDNGTYGEVSVTGDNTNFSPSPTPELFGESGNALVRLEGEVTGGEAGLRGVPTVTIFGEIQ